MPRDLGLDSNRTNDGNRGRDYSPIVVDKEGIADSDAKAGGPFEIVSVDHTTTASPDNKSGSDDEDDVRMSNYGSFFRRPVMSDKTNQRDELHPYTSILTLSDVDDCVKLEEAAFPENERCSREKFEYRLTRCPELSLGLFSMAPLDKAGNRQPRELVAHVVSTRTPTPFVTDASMTLPSNWRENKLTIPKESGTELPGHQDRGATIALHSLAVSPKHQRKGLGTTLLKSYISRIKDAQTAERIALLAHKPMVEFYKRFGFKDMGESDVTFGGGAWQEMILELKEQA